MSVTHPHPILTSSSLSSPNPHLILTLTSSCVAGLKYYDSHGCRWFYINKKSGSDPRYTKKGRCCMKTKIDLDKGWRANKDLPNYGNSGFYEMLPPSTPAPAPGR